MDDICDQIFEVVCKEFSKDERKQIFESKILNPCVKYIGNRLWPYIFFLIFLILLIILILIFMTLLTLKMNQNIKK